MITHIDHIILVTPDIEGIVAFYARVLKMAPQTLASGQRALDFGQQRIALRTPDEVLHDHAAVGACNLCLISDWPMDEVVAHLRAEDVHIDIGPVARDGAMGPLLSVYFSDPDGNLIEVSQPLPRR
ncbi:VOC family protein [Pseudooceanicola sp.]|uniref:VOC family protein n=1 Tax=Pseudooceanicola sp. TaxID=1914328 RepID=UPI002616CAB3|nr:VOC family protein [Pseudooceanicola sp.]MDF1854453.1 VOC family protein [Pseudooceanicola sp.]